MSTLVTDTDDRLVAMSAKGEPVEEDHTPNDNDCMQHDDYRANRAAKW